MLCRDAYWERCRAYVPREFATQSCGFRSCSSRATARWPDSVQHSPRYQLVCGYAQHVASSYGRPASWCPMSCSGACGCGCGEGRRQRLAWLACLAAWLPLAPSRPFASLQVPAAGGPPVRQTDAYVCGFSFFFPKKKARIFLVATTRTHTPSPPPPSPPAPKPVKPATLHLSSRRDGFTGECRENDLPSGCSTAVADKTAFGEPVRILASAHSVSCLAWRKELDPLARSERADPTRWFPDLDNTSYNLPMSKLLAWRLQSSWIFYFRADRADSLSSVHSADANVPGAKDGWPQGHRHLLRHGLRGKREWMRYPTPLQKSMTFRPGLSEMFFFCVGSGQIGVRRKSSSSAHSRNFPQQLL